LDPGEPMLDIAHGVIAEITNETAAEPRKAGVLRHLESPEVVVDVGERIAGLRAGDRLLAAKLGTCVATHLDARPRRQTDERIAAETLAADNGFQQITVGPVGKLEVNGERRIEVREGLDHHRYPVITGTCEPVEFNFSHESLQHGKTERRRTTRLTGAPVRGRAAPGSPAARRGRLRLRSTICAVHDQVGN